MSSKVLLLLIMVYSVEACTPILYSPWRDRKNTTLLVDPYAYGEKIDGVLMYYAICGKTVQPLEVNCSIYSTKYSQVENSTDPVVQHSFCGNLTFSGGKNENRIHDVKLISLNMYYSGKILIKSYLMEDDIVINAKFNIYDSNSTDSYPYIEYNIPIGLSSKSPSLIDDASVLESSLVVVVSSRKACSGSEKCLIKIGIEGSPSHDISPFKTNLHYAKIMNHDHVFAGKGYYIEGHDSTTGQYKLLHDEKPEPKEILSLESGIEYFTGNNGNRILVCQVLSRTSKVTKFNCQHVWHGSVRYSDVIVVPDEVKIIGIRIMGHNAMLISENINCVKKDCWNLFVSYIGKSTITRRISFDCIGDRKNLITHARRWNVYSILYGCERADDEGGNKSHFHTATVVLGQVKSRSSSVEENLCPVTLFSKRHGNCERT